MEDIKHFSKFLPYASPDIVSIADRIERVMIMRERQVTALQKITQDIDDAEIAFEKRLREVYSEAQIMEAKRKASLQNFR